METLSHCPLCDRGLRDSCTRWAVGAWSIVTCESCGAGITNPRPAIDEIGAYYRSSFFSVRPDARFVAAGAALLKRKMSLGAFISTVRSVILNEIKYRHDWTLQGGSVRRSLLAPLRWLLALTYEPIQSLPARPGVVLDIGFGRGEFLHRARELGWECHGVEVSDTSVQWGRDLGFATSRFDGSFQRKLDYPDGFFDLISLNSVLEHVHHPILALRECHRLLKPGGRLFILVPNFECRDKEYLGEHWRMWSPPQHLFHFTARNVCALLEETGFGGFVVRYKKWLNPITEKLSLKSLRPHVSTADFKKAAWYLRFGKRLDHLRGRLSAGEIAPGMAIEAVKRSVTVRACRADLTSSAANSRQKSSW